MVEFGARLSLKDNMSATLKKNLKTQKEYSKQVNKTSKDLKNLGKTKAKPTIDPKDNATKKNKKIKQDLKNINDTHAKPSVSVKDGATKVLNGIKSTLSTIAKGVTIGVTAVGAGATALAGASISEGAKLEQSIGGVDTLFKGDANIVKANADMAYKSAGLSANAYMETVTSFSASLLQSLSGDTAESAKVADMAIIDMADNANKFGTDMGSIQNAYQGFAKQNYTMLDNLKLGYGGTQEEMQRLLADASKLSGVEYELGNLADMYNAIHVIQENMGVAGTTADEASKTFTGSFSAMKSAFSNLMGAMSTGGDVDGALEQLVSSAETFLMNNAIPMVKKIILYLPRVVKTVVQEGLPMLKEAGQYIVVALKAGITELLPTSMQGIIPMFENIVSSMMPIVQQLGDMFGRVAPLIGDSLNGAFGEGGGLLSSFTNLLSSSIPVVESILKGLIQIVDAVTPIFALLMEQVAQTMPSVQRIIESVITAILPIFSRLGAIVEAVMPVTTQIFETLAEVVEMVFPLVSELITMALDASMPIIQAFSSLIQKALPIVVDIIRLFCGILKTLFPVIQQIFTDLGDKIARVITEIIIPIVEKFGGIFQKIAPVIQGAVEIISSVISVAWSIISPILDLLISTFELVWSILDPIIDDMVEAFTWLWEKLEPVFQGIADGMATVGDALSGVAEWAESGVDTVAGWFGFAYGKDRVPYDNYPAMLHAGEKVLTRNQADQYDRVMSTRGVSVTAIEQAPSGGTTAGGSTVNIEKLADTVIIEKDADVDKVVDEMITKFKQLVPNMT